MKRQRKRWYQEAIKPGLFALWLIAQPPLALASKPREVLRIDYAPSSIMLSGPATVYLNDKAIRIDAGKYEITATAPDWTAIVVSKPLKAYAEHPASIWRKKGFFMERSDSEDYLDPQKALTVEKVTYSGLPAQKMTWKAVEIDLYYQVRKRQQPCTVEFYQSTSLPISQMQAELIGSWYGVPHTRSVPLLLQHRLLDNTLKMKLLAKSIRKIPPTVSFKPRPGMRKVNEIADLVRGRYASAIENMFFDPAETGKKTDRHP